MVALNTATAEANGRFTCDTSNVLDVCSDCKAASQDLGTFPIRSLLQKRPFIAESFRVSVILAT